MDRLSGARPGRPAGAFVSIRGARHRTFKWLLAATVCIAAAATMIENGLHPALTVFLPLIVAALTRSEYGRPFLFSERTTLFLVGAFICASGLGLAAFGAFSLPRFLVYFTFGVTLIRVLTPLSDRNIIQVLVLSLGLILVNCILTNHLLFALAIPLYLGALLGTLMLFVIARSEARAWGEIRPYGNEEPVSPPFRTLAKWVAFACLLSAALFVVLPRPFIVIPGLRAAMAGGSGGFGDLDRRLTYGEMVNMGAQDRIAFLARFHYGSPRKGERWRGRVLNKADAKGWYPADRARGMGRIVKPEESRFLVYDILPYRLQSNRVYVCGLPVYTAGRNNRPLLVTALGEVVVDSPFLYSESYTINSVVRPLRAEIPLKPIYTDKTGVTPTIQRLAEEWTRGANTRPDKARALLRRFEQAFAYSVQNPVPPEGENPLEYFLLKERKGNCEYFAGALGLMLRAVDVPARVVEGFLGQEETDVPDEYLIRFNRAHAWVEAVLDKPVWTTLDATPPRRLTPRNRFWSVLSDWSDKLQYKWVRMVVNFDRSDQRLIAEGLAASFSARGIARIGSTQGFKAILAIGAALGVVIAAGVGIFIAVRRHRRPISSVYTETMESLARKGLLDQVDPWHERNTEEISRRNPAVARAVHDFMRVYLKARFGGENGIPKRDVEAARHHLLKSL